MPSARSLLVAGLVTMAAAYTPPKGDPTWGPLITPNGDSPVTQGQTTVITWDPQNNPTDGVTVSLVLCKGPSSNCVVQDTAIVEGIPAAQKSYSWAAPCTLTPGVKSTDTGYGMLIIVDGTGAFQYSTQFSVLANPSCAAVSTTTTTAPISITTTVSTSGSSSSPSTVVTSSVTSVVSSSSMKTITTTGYHNSTSSSVHSTSSAVVPSSSLVTTTTRASGTSSTTSASATVTSFTGGAVKVAGGALSVVAAGLVAILAL